MQHLGMLLAVSTRQFFLPTKRLVAVHTAASGTLRTAQANGRWISKRQLAKTLGIL